MRKRKTVWNGVEYPSLRAAAKTLNVSYDTLQNRLRKGYTCDDDIRITNIKDKEIVAHDINAPSYTPEKSSENA